MKVLGIIVVLLALVIGIVPMFTDCQSQGRELVLQNGKTIPMKCHWTAAAELAMAVPLVGLGAVMSFSKRKETYRMLAVLGFLAGIAVILLPTKLIGVCANPDMICNMIMRPALILSGVIVSTVSLTAFFVYGRGIEKA